MNLREEDLRRILTTAAYLAAFSRNAGKVREVETWLRLLPSNPKVQEALEHLSAAHDLIFAAATEHRDNFCTNHGIPQ